MNVIIVTFLLPKIGLLDVGELDIEKNPDLEQTFMTLSKKIPIETKFKLLDFYVNKYAKNKKTDELDNDNEQYLCDMLFTDISKFVDQFYNYYVDKKEFGSEQYQCFLRGIVSHLTDHLLVEDVEKLHGKRKSNELSLGIWIRQSKSPYFEITREIDFFDN